MYRIVPLIPEKETTGWTELLEHYGPDPHKGTGSTQAEAHGKGGTGHAKPHGKEIKSNVKKFAGAKKKKPLANLTPNQEGAVTKITNRIKGKGFHVTTAMQAYGQAGVQYDNSEYVRNNFPKKEGRKKFQAAVQAQWELDHFEPSKDVQKELNKLFKKK